LKKLVSFLLTGLELNKFVKTSTPDPTEHANAVPNNSRHIPRQVLAVGGGFGYDSAAFGGGVRTV
jgi:protein-L-isoaspartate O-methyltransferase